MLRARFDRPGPPAEVLRVEEFSAPAPGPGEVRLRLRAAPINPADLNFIEGRYGVQPDLPATPGMEGVGVVDAVGASAGNFAVGDAVIGLQRLSSWAQTATVAADRLWKIPSEFLANTAPEPAWEQWAQLRVNPLTAWRLLTGFVDLAPDDVVLVNAANSGVGRCLLAVARERGWRIAGFVRRPDQCQELAALHPEAEFFLDDAEGWAAAKQQLAGRSVPLACNAVGADSSLTQLKLLSPRGVQVTYGAMARQPGRLPAGLMIFKELRLEGLWISQWQASAPREEVDAALHALAGLVAAGKLVQPVDQSFGLADLPAAVARAAASGRQGKVLLDLR